MNALTVVALVGAGTGLLSAVFAGWTSLKQRRTEDVRLGYDAMRDALANYRADNEDLRKRVFTAEQHVVDLTGKVNRCESDKAALEVQMSDLRRRLNDA